MTISVNASLSISLFMVLFVAGQSADVTTKLPVKTKEIGHRLSRQGPKIWDQWGEWSGCSVTCGIGKLSRWRHCIAGGCSQGEKEQQLKTCTFAACLHEEGMPKVWDQWGKWSCCSVSCGNGRITRWRHCVDGGCAAGEKEAQIRKCHLADCPG